MNEGPTARAARDHAEFFEVIAQLEAGEITAEQAQRRVMTIYQMGIGALIRALGEVDPGIVGAVTGRLQRDLGLVSEEYAARTGGQPALPAQEGPVAAAMAGASDDGPGGYRVTAKNDETLGRECVLLRRLVKTDQGLALGALLDLINGYEPDIKQATVIATLDRLIRKNYIDRPRKGYYGRSPHTADYLRAVEDEMEARGLPPITTPES